MKPVTYLDSSAIVKLAVWESESAALRSYVRRHRTLVSSSLARTEVLRALMPAGDGAVVGGRKILARVNLLRINNRVLDAAARLEPSEIRSLDAIHLATAAEFGDELGGLVTYDARMAEAAADSGHRVVAPG